MAWIYGEEFPDTCRPLSENSISIFWLQITKSALTEASYCANSFPLYGDAREQKILFRVCQPFQGKFPMTEEKAVSKMASRRTSWGGQQLIMSKLTSPRNEGCIEDCITKEVMWKITLLECKEGVSKVASRRNNIPWIKAVSIDVREHFCQGRQRQIWDRRQSKTDKDIQLSASEI